MKYEVLGTIAVGAIAKIIADDAKDWITHFSRKLIRFASSRFPEDTRGRWEEEWLAHCNDRPGSVAKFLHGVGCVRTSILENVTWTDLTAKAVFYPIGELLGILQALAYLVLIVHRVRRSERQFYGSAAWATCLRKRSAGLTVLGLAEEMKDEIRIEISVPRVLFWIPDADLPRILALRSANSWARWSTMLMPSCFRLAGAIWGKRKH